MSNNPSVGLLVQGISQSRLKMAKISYFSIEIQLSLNCILSEIFEILGVNKQMFICCDPNDPKKFDFSEISMTMPPILFRGLEMSIPEAPSCRVK